MYPFLIWCLLLLIVWVIIWYFRSDLRNEMLFSGVLALPFALTEPFFIPSYWNPKVLPIFSGGFNIESFIYCFVIAGISAVLFEALFLYKLKKRVRNYQNFQPFILYSSLVLLFGYTVVIYRFTTFSVLHSLFLAVFAFILYLLIMRRDLVKESLATGIIFVIIYITTLLLTNLVSPGFLQDWNRLALWGIYVFGIPLEEYITALLAAMCWSVVYKELMNDVLVKKTD